MKIWAIGLIISFFLYMGLLGLREVKIKLFLATWQMTMNQEMNLVFLKFT